MTKLRSESGTYSWIVGENPIPGLSDFLEDLEPSEYTWGQLAEMFPYKSKVWVNIEDDLLPRTPGFNSGTVYLVTGFLPPFIIIAFDEDAVCCLLVSPEFLRHIGEE